MNMAYLNLVTPHAKKGDKGRKENNGEDEPIWGNVIIKFSI
jgi:hypothetical protein